MKFRRKPFEIEAVQWTGNMTRVIELVGHDLPTFQSGSLRLVTRYGEMAVLPGDWIIRDREGELQPMSDSQFKLRYEPLEEDKP